MSEKKSRERLGQDRWTDEDKATLSYSDRRQKQIDLRLAAGQTERQQQRRCGGRMKNK